jgi:DivIVA domain-containing protein
MTDSNAHFRSVLRGYDPAQVDQHVHELAQAAAAARQEAAQRTIEVNKLETAHGQLRKEVERHVQRARTLEEEQMKASAPTYATLGERIGSILTLADKEASELRERAKADAANHHALADESALATRQDAEHYATETRSAAQAEAVRFMEDAKRQADSVLDDADRQAMARREEAEAVYERSRAKSATAAVDFETTLAARRDSSALEFAAEVTAAEQQLATVRMQSEQTRIEAEQSQQEAATRSEQQLEQAMNHAHTLVAEAKTKAERIRGDSERELAAATQRRDSINAQLSNVRQMLAALGGAAVGNALNLAAPAADQTKPANEQTKPAAEQTKPAADQTKPAATVAASAAPVVATPAAAQVKAVTNAQGAKDPKQTDVIATDKPKDDKADDKQADSGQTVSAKS